MFIYTFQMAIGHHVEFLKAYNFICRHGREDRGTSHAKYRQNLSIDCKDIKIFQFFKIAAAAILDFQICEISLADSVWKAQTHYVKIGPSVVEIFDFSNFQNGHHRHLRFLK